MTETRADYDYFEELDEDVDDDLRRRAVETIKPLYDLRQNIAAFQKGVKAFDPDASDYGRMGPLRRWLMDNPGERLVDGETGLVAYLRPGGVGHAYEPAAVIQQQAPGLFQRLLQLGCLVVDDHAVTQALRAGQIVPVDIEKFRRTTERTPALIIEPVKEAP